MQDPRRVLETLAREFEPDYAEFGREFSRNCFNLRHLLPLLPANASVLDIGAGPGVVAIAMRAVGAAVTVVDKWVHYGDGSATGSAALACMAARYQRHGVAVRDLDLVRDALPFPSASFDMVMFLAVIEHLPMSPKRVLEEAKRVLKPGGVLVLEVPNIACLRNRLKLLFGRTIHFSLDDWYSTEPYCGHYRELTCAEVAQHMQLLALGLLWIRTSNTAFHNTKHRDGRYSRGLKLNSLFQWSKLIYLLACLPVPTWRFQILAAARKP
jgi:ubiquinone/menaquinone biosynthesis C-methylase UbiE